MAFNPGDPVSMQELIAYLQAMRAQQPQAPQAPNPIATLGKGVAKGYLKKLAKDKLLEQLASKDALPSINNNFMYSSSTPEALNAAWNAPASGGVDMASIMNPATEQMMTPMAEGASETATATAPEAAPGMMTEAAPYLGAAAAAYGGYKSINAAQHGGEGLRSGLTTTGAGVGTAILPGVGTALGAGIGNAFGYGLQGNGWKNKAALIGLGPVGITLLAAKMAGVPLVHKTTGQYQQENTSNFLKQGKDNQAWQNYVQGMRGNYGTPGAKPKGNAFHGGDYATWEDYKKAGLNAGDLTGVAGNMKTFGPDWAGYNQDQRKKITQGIIDAGLYKSSKGDIGIIDEARAKQIRDQILKG